MKKVSLPFFVAFIAAYFGYQEFKPVSKVSNLTVGQKRISIMTYNVENLFDIINDPSKNDETFLPKFQKNKDVRTKCKRSGRAHWVEECLETNWTQYKLDMKMERLARVIKSYKNGGPDILMLQEVENINVLQELNHKHLGYPTVVLIEGPDKRGIDTAVLSKLKTLNKPKLHTQNFKPNSRWGKSKIKPTRGILEVTLELPNGAPLSVFSIHFPSQGSPTESRRQAVLRLNELAKNHKDLVVAGGDFNITKIEDEKEKLFTEVLSKDWMVSHLIGCEKCRGSNYFHRSRSWSFLDALLFSKNFGDGWKIDTQSIDIFNKLPVQKNKYNSPAKFLMGRHRYGVSDHWPVVAEIYL